MSDEMKIENVDAAVDSLAVTAMRVKEERDSLLAAAKALQSLIESTASVFDAPQIKWLQGKPAYGRFCEAIESAENS